MVSDKIDGSFNVILRACPHGSSEPCPHALEIFLQNDQYTLENKGGVIKFLTPTKQIPIPVQMTGLKVSRSGMDIRIRLESVPLTILWDTKKFVQIDATASIWNRTAGLCGTNDGSPKTDFTSKDGKLHETPSTFVDTWKMPSLDKDKSKCQLEKQDLLSIECEPSIEEKANMICTDLIKNAKLKSCIKLFNEDVLMKNCISDYCYCKDVYEKTSCVCNGIDCECDDSYKRTGCICSGIDVIVKDCLFRGVQLPADWRDFQICRTYFPFIHLIYKILIQLIFNYSN